MEIKACCFSFVFATSIPARQVSLLEIRRSLNKMAACFRSRGWEEVICLCLLTIRRQYRKYYTRQATQTICLQGRVTSYTVSCFIILDFTRLYDNFYFVNVFHFETSTLWTFFACFFIFSYSSFFSRFNFLGVFPNWPREL